MQDLRALFKVNYTEFIIVFGGYCLSFFLVKYLVYPLQVSFLPQTAAFASLLFLPHGVRVISVWLLGERALLPLFASHLFIYSIFYNNGDTAFTTLGMVSVGTFCAYLAFWLFSVSGINLTIKNLNIIHWRAILLMGFLASVFNAVGNSLLMMSSIDDNLHIQTLVFYLIGDTLGVFTLLILLTVSLRIHRGVSSTSHANH